MKRVMGLAAVVLGVVLSSVLVRGEKPEMPRSCVPVDKNHKRHEQFLKDKEAALAKGPIQVVFVGDSITDFWRNAPKADKPNAFAGKEVWDANWAKYNPLNLGISGEHTEDVLFRLRNGEIDGYQAKLFVMMIGTNNLAHPPQQTPEDVIMGIRCLVDTIKDKQPGAKILLLGIFPRGAEASDGFRAKIKQVNEAIAKLDDGGKTVKFMDLADKFLVEGGKLPKETFPDYLHPNARGYVIWADAIQGTVEEMVK